MVNLNWKTFFLLGTLKKRLESKNIPVNSMHPGGVNTALESKNKTLLGKVLKLMLKPFFRSPQKGEESIIYLAHMMDLDVTVNIL
ncbi:MAG: hypothetical protein CM15mP127_00990 [Gammaproteobacteria bacterium]|nr:MAG: hypothetical protein CM15mP127_00990 [Gammaproteobacteria bacterium]